MKVAHITYLLLVHLCSTSVANRKIRSNCMYKCEYSACAGKAPDDKDKRDNSIVYFGLGAALSFSLLMMNAPAPAPAPAGRTTAPNLPRETLPVLLERAAGGGVQLLSSFKGVLERPDCSARMVCVAEKELDLRRDWSAALGMLGSVAAGTMLDDPLTLSDAVLPFLFQRPHENCHKLSPSCDVTVN